MAVTIEKIALVTGAGRGIGRAVALGLAHDGATVAVNDLDADRAEAVAAEIRASGGRSIACPFSVVDFNASRAAVAAIVERFGRIDVLVSNAGVASAGRSLLRTDVEEADRMWRLNALATLVLCQSVLPSMRERGAGNVVVVSSAAVAESPPNSGPYTMAKAALEALAYTLAAEERRHGIRVNVVAPGLIDTRLAREVLGRTTERGGATPALVAPEAVADAVRFYVSSGADHVTGQKLQVGTITP